MKNFDKSNYRFIDLSETDHTQFSQLELDKMIEDTKEVLAMTKGKVKMTPMNLGLAGGLLAVRGGQFVKINALTGQSGIREMQPRMSASFSRRCSPPQDFTTYSR